MSGLVWLFNCLGGVLLTGNVLFAYDNIALNKTAWQQYPYSPTRWGADKAVDGQYSNRSSEGGQCTISDNDKRTATWRVNLGSVLSIHHITIYTRTDNVVWRCSTYGVYGEYCDLPCPQNCQGEHCNIENGTCLGCAVGYIGSRCNQECDGRFYGAGCSLSCGSCLNFEQCHHINGTCLQGCDRGFQGDICIEECPVGRYGYNCEDVCNINCGVPGRCNRASGVCQGGCQEGWKGTKCDNKCAGGKFGQNCAQSCEVCLYKEQCHHINGTCLNGCDRGYQGTNCIQECAWGFHAYGCTETCSTTCYNKTCDAITGACPLVSAPDSQENDIAPIIGGAVAIIVVTLAVVTLIFVFRRKNTSGTGKEQNDKEKRAEQLSSENAIPHTDIYDKISETGPYQELGPRTEVSDNSRYQEFGPRTGKSENGEYQELGPRAEVPDDGGYQGLGPRIQIKDQSKDNKDYQELGQMSQPSHYDSLH